MIMFANVTLNFKLTVMNDLTVSSANFTLEASFTLEANFFTLEVNFTLNDTSTLINVLFSLTLTLNVISTLNISLLTLNAVISMNVIMLTLKHVIDANLNLNITLANLKACSMYFQTAKPSLFLISHWFFFAATYFYLNAIVKLGFSSKRCNYTMSFDFFIGTCRDGTKIKYFNQNQSKAYNCYKNLNHRLNYCKLSLSGDIEINPGPTFTNYGRTICAPYSQGDVNVFGENAGRQCIAMSYTCVLPWFNTGFRGFS